MLGFGRLPIEKGSKSGGQALVVALALGLGFLFGALWRR